MKYLIILAIGAIFPWAAQKIYHKLSFTYEEECSAQLGYLSNILAKFKNDCGRFPTEQEGLSLLAEPSKIGCNINPLLPKVPVDPWGRDFIYLANSTDIYLLSSSPSCRYITIKR